MMRQIDKMNFLIKLMCFTLSYGVYLATDTHSTYVFVPTTCLKKNEMYKYCLNDCSDCEHRGICPQSGCKTSGGCDCMYNFVRIKPGGPCEHISKCPIPKCGKNEHFRACGPSCERCDSLPCQVISYQHKCFCNEGYKRDLTGHCIPEDECPPRKCTRYEEKRDSGLKDEFYMRSASETASDSIQNKTQCYCKEGQRRNSLGHCIDEALCAKHCFSPEEYQLCVRKCNTTCRNYGDIDCVEDKQCFPGCFCPEGMMMNDFRRCVKLEECPPGSNPYAPTTLPEVETTIPSSINHSDDSEGEAVTATEPDTRSSSFSSQESEDSELTPSPEEVSEDEADSEEEDTISDTEETPRHVIITTSAPKIRRTRKPSHSAAKAHSSASGKSQSSAVAKSRSSSKKSESEEDMDDNM